MSFLNLKFKNFDFNFNFKKYQNTENLILYKKKNYFEKIL